MLKRFMRIDLFVATVAALAVGAAASGAPAAIPGIPSFYIDYNANCTFTMSVDGGIAITSPTAPGPTLPPGTYQLLISMPNPNQGYAPCATPTFTLTGPGVNSVTVFPGQQLNADQVVVLQPSSTYVADDANAPGATQEVFTTAASGSNNVLLPTTTTPQPATGATQPDYVGSAIAPYRGVLRATVAAGGATLKFASHTASSLRPGKYNVDVDDTSPRAGFSVQRTGGKAVRITSPAFVGKRTRQITFTPGTWTFFSEAGKTTRFTVSAR